VAVTRASRVYDAEPLGPPQPRYLNAVLELETSLTAPALLDLLRRTELAAGRKRGARWSARTLDLDLLLYGYLVLDTPGLAVPHPGIACRRFVLEPLAELCPDRLVPRTGTSVARLLAAAPPLQLALVGRYPL
jgi:2-amino-4-hydroxy-6-hydroxymethyldihydropteridine diphosphokinase